MYKELDPRLEQAWWVLRIGLGVGPFLAGLDKYFNLLANWPGYMSPLALRDSAIQRANLHAHRWRDRDPSYVEPANEPHAPGGKQHRSSTIAVTWPSVNVMGYFLARDLISSTRPLR